MKHGSLFSGIGGFDLAAEWMGWENVFHCEWNDFGQKILKYYWPNAESFYDITKTDFTKYANRIDILTGGFPCQPYSQAGKRLGKDDERHLWPEMLRAIWEIQPRWVVGENVSGLVNWSGGLVFEEVQTDLEAQGYEVQPFLLPAAGVGAPHQRERIWFVAHSNGRGDIRLQHKLGKPTKPGQRWPDNAQGSNKDATNPLCIGQQGQGWAKRQGNTKENGDWQKYRTFNDDGWPSEPIVRRGNDGLSKGMDGITFSNWAKETIKAYGNAIVPQVAFQIFKAIALMEV